MPVAALCSSRGQPVSVSQSDSQPVSQLQHLASAVPVQHYTSLYYTSTTRAYASASQPVSRWQRRPGQQGDPTGGRQRRNPCVGGMFKQGDAHASARLPLTSTIQGCLRPPYRERHAPQQRAGESRAAIWTPLEEPAQAREGVHQRAASQSNEPPCQSCEPIKLATSELRANHKRE
eukprot:89921-Prorocentrum_minimum.AAC.1